MDRVALATAAALAVCLVVGLLMPVYTDEVAWRMLLARAPLEAGLDRGLGDQCGPSTVLHAPVFMQPMRHLSAWANAVWPDPRVIRVAGVAGALAWLGLLWAVIGRAAPAARAAVRALAFGLAGLGVLPFLLVWSRPEQTLLLADTLAILVALGGAERRGRAAGRGAALVLGAVAIVTLGAHPKGVVFLPVLLVAVALSGAGPAARWARIAVIAFLVGAGAVAFRYWQTRLACPGDPVLQAMFARENIAAASQGQPLFDRIALLIRNAWPYPYARSAAPAPVYMSHWLPDGLIAAGLGGPWAWLVRTVWKVVYLVTALLVASGLIAGLVRRRIEPRQLLAAAVFATLLGWSALQLQRNAYEAAQMLPLTIVALVLALPTLRRPEGAIRHAGMAVAALSMASMAALLGCYLVPLARIAARHGPLAAQPYSYSPWAYPAERTAILHAARQCGIDPSRAHDLLVDDLTYWPFLRARHPQHRNALLGPWNGSVTDPLAYLHARRSSGAVIACAYLPADLRARARARGAYCCLGPS